MSIFWYFKKTMLKEWNEIIAYCGSWW